MKKVAFVVYRLSEKAKQQPDAFSSSTGAQNQTQKGVDASNSSVKVEESPVPDQNAESPRRWRPVSVVKPKENPSEDKSLEAPKKGWIKTRISSRNLVAVQPVNVAHLPELASSVLSDAIQSSDFAR